MFRHTPPDDYEARAAAGARPLFTLGPFVFQDTLDDAGALHHFVVERGALDGDESAYEADQPIMYEFLARYLAGEYEKDAYDLEQSPSHHALLDLLELATARARGGDSEFSLAELDGGTEELMDEDAPLDEEE